MSVVGAAGDETGAVLAVDAAVIVGVTAVDVAGSAAACAVDAVPVVVVVDVKDAAAAELQTFPGDAVSAAGQQVSLFDCL